MPFGQARGLLILSSDHFSYMYLLIPSDGSAAAVVDPYDRASALPLGSGSAHADPRAAKKIIAAAEKEGVKIGPQVITTHHRASLASRPLPRVADSLSACAPKFFLSTARS